MCALEYAQKLHNLETGLQIILEQHEAACRSMINEVTFRETDVVDAFSEMWNKLVLARSAHERDRDRVLGKLRHAYQQFADMADVLPPEVLVAMETH